MPNESLAQTWIPVPIRNEIQRNAGLSGGEGFQQVQSISYSKSNPNIVYMGVDTTWIWKSIDGGENWTPLSRSQNRPAVGVSNLYVDPQNSDIVLAAVITGRFDGDNIGIFRTIDGGITWNRVYKTASNYVKNSRRGKLFIKIDDTYFAGTNENLIRSDNDGADWESTIFNHHIRDLDIDPTDSNYLLIATDDGFFRYNITSGLVANLTNAIGLPGIDQYPENISTSSVPTPVVYLAYGRNDDIWESETEVKAIYKSVGDLDLFTEITPDTNFNYLGIVTSKINSGVAYTMPSKPKDDDGIILPGRIYSTIDAGEHWTEFRGDTTTDSDGDGFIDTDFLLRPDYKRNAWDRSLLQQHNNSTIIPHPTIANYALASIMGRGTVVKTIDSGNHWIYSGNGYSGGRAVEYAFIDVDTYYMALTDHGIFKTENDGESFIWYHSNTAAGISVSNDVILTSLGRWHFNTPAISYDGGETWTKFPADEGRNRFFYIHKVNSNIMYHDTLVSIDGGQNWNEINTPNVTTTVRAVYQEDNDIIYATRIEDATKNQGLYIAKSIDRGQTFSNISDFLPIIDTGESNATVQLRDIAIHPTNENILYLATKVGLYILNNGVTTKVLPESGLSADNFEEVEIDPNSPNIIYVGAKGDNGNNGVWRSNDGGQNWQKLDDVLLHGEVEVWGMNINPYNSNLYIGTSHGTYKVTTVIRADVNQDSQINTTDAQLTLRNSLGLDMTSTNWQTSSTTGDVNCDLTSNSTDAMLIIRHSLGLSMVGSGWCEG